MRWLAVAAAGTPGQHGEEKNHATTHTHALPVISRHRQRHHAEAVGLHEEVALGAQGRALGVPHYRILAGRCRVRPPSRELRRRRRCVLCR